MTKRITVPDITARKGATPIVVLTCYTAPMARILDAHVDILLVGDSLGMVVYGMESTLGVSLETMTQHGRAVAKHAERGAGRSRYAVWQLSSVERTSLCRQRARHGRNRLPGR